MPDSSRFEEEVYQALPFLRTSSDAFRETFFSQAQRASAPPKAFICMEGDRCRHLPLVLSGSARVYKSGDQGREITLYRLETGESCILTASCILTEHPFPAFAVAESEVTAALIPAVAFRRWLDEHDAWRQYVFDLLWQRLADVITVVEAVTFRRMDARIATYLVEAASGGTDVRTTHEAIADELGTAREVVSRNLKEFEREGLLKLSRGTIHLTNPEGLRKKAHIL
ncbi:Crp/Fnr family transcriptional regulator [Rhodocaloribacter sp.]